MKKFILISVVSIVLFIAAIIALSLGVTQPVTNVAEKFFGLVKASKLEEAYSITSRNFQQGTDLEAFKQFIGQSGLSTYQDVFWSHRSIHNTVGDAKGTITTAQKKFPVEVQLVYEDEAWKIQQIKTDGLTQTPQQAPSPTPTSSSVPQEMISNLPPRKDLRALATNSILAFNRAIEKKDFSDFHARNLSEPFKKEYTPDKLRKAFQVFIDKEVELKGVKDTPAIFDETPLLIDDILSLNGYYIMAPRPVRFKLKYLKEADKWKLTAISVNTEDDLKASIEGLKLPSKQEQELMIKATLLDFDASVQQEDFSEFHAKALSTPFQHKFTPQEIKEAFYVFIEKQIQMDIIEDMTPIFDEKPKIDELGFLVFKGHFKTSPNLIHFSLDYVYEEDDWKLADLHIKFKKPAT